MMINLAVYRVRHSFYQTSNGFAKKIELIKMKKLSNGFDILEEDFANIGSDSLVFDAMDKLKDGQLYSVEVINVSTDHETGFADDWDLSLVEYKEGQLPEPPEPFPNLSCMDILKGDKDD